MSYTSAPTIGGYGNINATNYGQYNAQGYDTSQYGYNTAPSMSLGQAAWIKATSSNYRSPYASMSNLQYMQAVDQRAKMFWHDAAVKGAAATAYAGGYLYFNAGQAFMSVGKTLGKGVETASPAINVAPEIAWEGAGPSLRIGKGLYAFGKSGEYGWMSQALWHKSLTPAFKAVANGFAQGGEWAGNMFGEGVAHLGNKLGWEEAGQQIKGAGNAVGGWLKSAGSWGKTAEQVGKEGENLTGAARTAYRAGMYFADKGVIAGVTKAGLRGTAFAAAPLAYLAATGAVLNFGINGMENVLTAGDEATQSSALTFQSLKGKIFNASGRDASVRNAEDIAKAIRRQVVNETGISGAASRFLFGHKLNGEIEKKTALFGAFADYGLIDKSSSGTDFVRKAQKLEKAVKSLSHTFQMTASQTLDMVRVMKSQGISNGQLTSAGSNTAMTANMSGYSNQQVMSIQSRGSEAFRGTYYSPEVGVGIANDVIQRTSIMANRDPEYNQAMYALRGKDSANVFLTQMQAKLANSSEVKDILVASLYKKQNGRYVFTGQVNKKALASEMSGGHTYLSDFNTQTELVQSYKTQLTSSERAKADLAIQNYSEHLNSRQMNSLIGSALKTSGYLTKEEGLAAQYAAQGLSPKVAAQLAKSMSRDTSNDVVSATYKADALRKLNLDARGKDVGINPLKWVGDNLDLGIVSNLASFTGGIANKVFGKRGAMAGELGMAAGTVTALLGEPMAGIGIMAGSGAIAYGANTHSYLNGSLGIAQGVAGMRMAALYDGGALASSAVTAGATVAGAVGGYMGSGLAAGAARSYYGMTTRQMLNKHGNIYAGARVGGGLAGGAATTGLGMYLAGAALTTPIGWAALAVGATTGAAVGAYEYTSERDSNNLLRKRQEILGATRTVRDLAMLGGTDLSNELMENYVNTHAGVADTWRRQPIKYTDKFKASLNHWVSVANKIDITRAGLYHLINNVAGENGGLSPVSRRLASAQSALDGRNLAYTMMHSLGKDHIAHTLFQRESMNLLGTIYRQMGQSGKNALVNEMGDWALPYLEGEHPTRKVTLKEAKDSLAAFNKGKAVAATLGETSALAGALNNLGTLMTGNKKLYSKVRGNISNSTVVSLARKYGIGSEELYNYINKNFSDASTPLEFHKAATALGGIGLNLGMSELSSLASKAVGHAVDVKHAGSVGDAVSAIIEAGGINKQRQRALLNALGNGGGNFGAAMQSMVETSGKLYNLSRHLKGGQLTAAQARKMIGQRGYNGALTMEMFNAAKGNDNIMTSAELAMYSSHSFITGRIGKASADELALSPEQQKESVVKNISDMAGYLKTISGHFAPGKGNPKVVPPKTVPVDKSFGQGGI